MSGFFAPNEKLTRQLLRPICLLMRGSLNVKRGRHELLLAPTNPDTLGD